MHRVCSFMSPHNNLNVHSPYSISMGDVFFSRPTWIIPVKITGLLFRPEVKTTSIVIAESSSSLQVTLSTKSTRICIQIRKISLESHHSNCTQVRPKNKGILTVGDMAPIKVSVLGHQFLWLDRHFCISLLGFPLRNSTYNTKFSSHYENFCSRAAFNDNRLLKRHRYANSLSNVQQTLHQHHLPTNWGAIQNLWKPMSVWMFIWRWPND